MDQIVSPLARTAIVSEREEFWNRFEQILGKDLFVCERIRANHSIQFKEPRPFDLILIDQTNGAQNYPDSIKSLLENFTARYIVDVVPGTSISYQENEKRIQIPEHINDYVLNSVFSALAKAVLQEKRQLEYSSLLLHDVRSPLNSLIGYLELLINGTFGELSNGQKNILEKAVQMADDTLDIVEELSDVYKHDQNSFQINPQQFNLNDLLENVLATIWVKADQKNIHIRKKIDSNIREIYGDDYYLQRLLINLILNAIHHSPKDSTITIEAAPEESGWITLSVHDTGWGVSAENLPRLFDKYFRMERKNSTGRGQGLGLYICRLIAEAHGGKIEATANPEGGLTVSVFLPSST
ncbi:MAG: sensor histidine kinase [Calditrichaeota bacterium]|nr:HAMP domain-containing histidine kinase [Calditrichota bacterium]RQW06383.1 MAG: sensor histidine kinase [Calditrichota bacterium]